MRQINRRRVGSQNAHILPKLEGEMIPGTRTVLTFDGVREDEGRNGPFMALSFREFPGHEMLTNSTQEDALIALIDAKMLPNDLDSWPGYRVAFYKRYNENPDTKERVPKWYAMDPNEQAAALAEFDAAVASGGGARQAASETDIASTSPLAPKNAPSAKAEGTAPAGGRQRAGSASKSAR